MILIEVPVKMQKFKFGDGSPGYRATASVDGGEFSATGHSKKEAEESLAKCLRDFSYDARVEDK